MSDVVLRNEINVWLAENGLDHQIAQTEDPWWGVKRIRSAIRRTGQWKQEHMSRLNGFLSRITRARNKAEYPVPMQGRSKRGITSIARNTPKP
jgi:hypothetical protein